MYTPELLGLPTVRICPDSSPELVHFVGPHLRTEVTKTEVTEIIYFVALYWKATPQFKITKKLNKTTLFVIRHRTAPMNLHSSLIIISNDTKPWLLFLYSSEPTLLYIKINELATLAQQLSPYSVEHRKFIAMVTSHTWSHSRRGLLLSTAESWRQTSSSIQPRSSTIRLTHSLLQH